MDEDRFTTEVRKFLREVGVTSQREIERVARDAQGAGVLKLRMVLTAESPNASSEHVIERSIDLSDEQR